MIFVDIGGTSIKLWRTQLPRSLEPVARVEGELAILPPRRSILQVLQSEELVVSATGRVEKVKKHLYKVTHPLYGEYNLKARLAVNDAVAFAYYAWSLSSKDSILAVVLGGGANAVYMDKYLAESGKFLKTQPEAGHMKFGEGTCLCGQEGCAELYISAKFFERMGEDPRNASKETVKMFIRNLARYIASLVQFVLPSEVFIGGGLSKLLTPDFVEYVKSAYPYYFSWDFDLYIVRELDANLRGLQEILAQDRVVSSYL